MEQSTENNLVDSDPMKVRAKFRCSHVVDYGGQKQANLSAVYSATGENADFTKVTPWGEMKINIESTAPASRFFKPGNEYYLTFEFAEHKV